MGQKVLYLIYLAILTTTTTCLDLNEELGFEEQTLQDGYNYALTNPKALELFDLKQVRACVRPGQMCKDCKTRVNCIHVGPNPGDFEEVGHHTCEPNETCKRKNCQVGPNPPCGEEAKKKFKCLNIGMFPDQFNCQRLHMCAVGTDGKFVEYTIQCGGKWMYNPLSTYCDVPFPDDGFCYPEDRVPEWPVPACLEDGQQGALTENKSIYYTCEKYENTSVLYPMLRLCPNGGQFQDETMMCLPKAPPTNQSTADSFEELNGAYDEHFII